MLTKRKWTCKNLLYYIYKYANYRQSSENILIVRILVYMTMVLIAFSKAILCIHYTERDYKKI